MRIFKQIDRLPYISDNVTYFPKHVT